MIHDEPSEAAEASAAWVLLYPEGENVGVVCVDGEPQSIPSIAFADLLAAVDAAIDDGIGHPPRIGAWSDASANTPSADLAHSSDQDIVRSEAGTRPRAYYHCCYYYD